MKIVFFTKYTYAGASSRYRVYQYLDYFLNCGFNISVKPFFTDDYVYRLYHHKTVSPFFLASRYLNRIWNVLQLQRGSFIYIEYELLPYFPAWFEAYLNWRRFDYVVDYDDAIFHNYDGNKKNIIKFLFRNKIPQVIKRASKVITGSEYLTRFAHTYNKNVFEIPTSVDFNKYQTVAPAPKSNIFTIGWIGTPSSGKNVLEILPAIQRFLSQYTSQLVLIGFDKTLSHLFNGLNVVIKDWNSDTEISLIKTFDVGIMPLSDTPFNRGKCGFKLIQYMACGIPTIFSPLVANVNINRNNLNLAAEIRDDWFKCLVQVYEQQTYFKEVVGSDNKLLVKDYYSIQANSEKLISVFK